MTVNMRRSRRSERLDAVRAARNAPWEAPTILAAANDKHPDPTSVLRSRIHRGRCDRLLTDAWPALDTGFKAAALAVSCCPPALTALAGQIPDQRIADAGRGTPGWAGRLADHRRAPRRKLASTVASGVYSSMYTALVHPCIPPATLERFVANERWEIRAAVADNPICHAALLERLSTDKDWSVRMNTARHPAAAADLVGCLSRDPDEHVRWAAAGNPACPPEALRTLGADPAPQVRVQVANNLSTDSRVLAALAEDDHGDVRYAALARAA